MKVILKPNTKLGKLSVGLNLLFLVSVVLSILFVKVLGILNYDNRWWDITAAIIFPASIVAFVTGIIAVKRGKEKNVLVYFSIFIGVCVILFILLHSLFISD